MKTRDLAVQEIVEQRRFGGVDLVIVLAVLCGLFIAVRVTDASVSTFAPSEYVTLDTSPWLLPWYAARSLSRMATGLVAATLFTFVVGYWAAKSRRAERILVPGVDILQSVPVLGFVAIATTPFFVIFGSNSTLALEGIVTFAVFTAMAWNMTLSFYHSLRMLPSDLVDAVHTMHLSRWLRLWRLEAPSAAIGLVWNAMMGFAGAWFMLVASEAFTYNGQTYLVPGLGSYAQQALTDGSATQVAWAIVAMLSVIVLVNWLFWRPLAAWAERFKKEDVESAVTQQSAILNMLRRARLPKHVGGFFTPLRERFNNAMRVTGFENTYFAESQAKRRTLDIVVFGTATVLVGAGIAWMLVYIDNSAGLSSFVEAAWYGVLTLSRVAAVLVLSTIVWVPIGVWIGRSPRITKIAQPVVLVAASFPANLLFPLVTAVFVALTIGLSWGSIFLMALGAQWYILFNVIAGASAIPTDLVEAADDLGLSRTLRWRRLFGPAIFPAFVTGALTAAGGAWNASIVAEVVTWGDTTLVTAGLGSYITEAQAHGDLAKVLVGVVVMCVYVVLMHRLIWRPLYRVAENKYAIT